MKFTDIPRELCIGPGNTVDEWLKAALLHEKGYATANVLQKQNTFGGVNSNYNLFKVKQKHTMSIQLINNVHGRMNRELGNTRIHNRTNINSSPNQMSVSQSFLKPCCLCGNKLTLEHKDKCAARNVNCSLCGKRGHFAKCCNSAKPQADNVISDEEDDFILSSKV